MRGMDKSIFLAVSFKENCDPNILLSDTAPVHDDPPPKPETIPNCESTTQADNRIARNEAAVRKTNEANEERRKKGLKISRNVCYHEADARIKSSFFFALGNEGKKRFLQQLAHTNLNSVNLLDQVNSIRPGITVDDTVKSALLHEKGYVRANTLQKQNPSAASNSTEFINSSNQFQVKQEPLMSIQTKNYVQNRMNRALGKGNFKSKYQQHQPNTQSKPCYFCGKRFTPEHKAKSQARGAICRSCGKKRTFRKMM